MWFGTPKGCATDGTEERFGMKARLIATAGFLALTATAGMAADDAYEIVGDAAKGERVFRKCMACHAVGEDAKNKVGPALNGVLGRTAGTYGDFAFSAAMKEKGAEGLVWTPETLATFLEKPKELVDGTKMSFAGLRKPEERDDVIAYLAQFN